MERRVNAYNKNLQRITQDLTFLSHVITCDESWVHCYDSLTEQENEIWQKSNKPKARKIRQQKYDGKVMILVFFNAKGMIYWHHCDLQVVKGKRTSATKEYYLQELKKLKKHISRKRPDLKTRWELHQDNVQPHTTSFITEWFEQNGIQLMAHPLYSPESAPCD